jgi:23S rRNA G2069 N7-methylase RlmK/C1962 C5-methylase RlmI
LRWSITGEVILRGEGAERARKGHLNIYMKWLSSIRGPVSNGDLVILKDESGDPIGLGFYEGIGSSPQKKLTLYDSWCILTMFISRRSFIPLRPVCGGK